jgi:uncharacterized protein YbjT (DUF2867 family)
MSTATTKTIAVFGATGNQGGSVTNALLAQGASVRALVRHPDSARARGLADRGVELVQTDIEDPQSLIAALKGVDAFFFMTTPPGGMQNPDTEGETKQGVALADAAAAANVPHVVFSSVGGAERSSGIPHFESKRRVEERLLQLGLRATIVRPVFFTDNFAYFSPSNENGELVLRMPLPDGIKLQMVAVRDIGTIVAAALLDPATVPSTIEIAGDELTGSEMAAVYSEKAGMPARYEALPLSVVDGQDDLQAMYRWFAETPAYQADIDQVRTIDPAVSDLRTWLDATNYTPAP